MNFPEGKSRKRGGEKRKHRSALRALKISKRLESDPYELSAQAEVQTVTTQKDRGVDLKFYTTLFSNFKRIKNFLL